ncbi:MAG: hypothetical protein LUQ17_05265 [Methanomicrobiales archaeon]|nr:hypothetical protein [Methanomicrobiales archaeon]
MERAIEALKQMLGLKTVVIRNGTEREIDASLLVPGDVVLLKTGAKVPAIWSFFYPPPFASMRRP